MKVGLERRKSDSKKQRKELIDEAAERLAEIFIQHIERKKRKKCKNNL